MKTKKKLHNISEFDKLKDFWYQKLKESGFDDIESDEYNLKTWSSQIAAQDSTYRHAKETYYYLATQFLNDYKFKNSYERIVWEYHSNGISIRNIVKLLNEVRKEKTYRRAIHELLQRLRNAMKRKYYYRPNRENEQ